MTQFFPGPITSAFLADLVRAIPTPPNCISRRSLDAFGSHCAGRRCRSLNDSLAFPSWWVTSCRRQGHTLIYVRPGVPRSSHSTNSKNGALDVLYHELHEKIYCVRYALNHSNCLASRDVETILDHGQFNLYYKILITTISEWTSDRHTSPEKVVAWEIEAENQ